MPEATPNTPAGSDRYLLIAALAAVVAITVLDAAIAGARGIAVLACVPILIAAFCADGRCVRLTAAAAVVGFFLSSLVADSAAGAWGAERAISFITVVATAGLALVLHRQRFAALRLRDAALSTSEMNRLLMSLLAHDLRAPLTLADQGFHYVEESILGGYPVDRALVSDVRARLQRSLRAIEMVLSLGREDQASAVDPLASLRRVSIRDELTQEIASFAYEAKARGKVLHADLDALGDVHHLVNVPVLRQALAIPLDNAVRYAVPGIVRISATTSNDRLRVRVEDDGPGLSAHRRDGGSSGSGLGLQLCGALLARSGGSLHLERDAEDGTALVITLPIQSPDAAESPPAPLAEVAVPA